MSDRLIPEDPKGPDKPAPGEYMIGPLIFYFDLAGPEPEDRGCL
jgi:hypothetical protein